MGSALKPPGILFSTNSLALDRSKYIYIYRSLQIGKGIQPIIKYFGNSAKFWLGLQNDFDLEEEKNTKGSLLNAIPTLPVNIT